MKALGVKPVTLALQPFRLPEPVVRGDSDREVAENGRSTK